jgi:hypothetical protein
MFTEIVKFWGCLKGTEQTQINMVNALTTVKKQQQLNQLTTPTQVVQKLKQMSTSTSGEISPAPKSARISLFLAAFVACAKYTIAKDATSSKTHLQQAIYTVRSNRGKNSSPADAAGPG